ncbi:hypothetical protein TW95_gp1807 [Pandoravirus inopinatum]|uniref:Uncharacterized protein n=1 Tax=Pandoravirus inopinatum TaxID=1605721 RepID=A0A0B5JBX8_9VIRU|nr:hypothetical protein TW95_gp1807 [Pandoravirus inopinatum]AJF98541.1 hypothetical protein [Pandoravirus inopinatum]
MPGRAGRDPVCLAVIRRSVHCCPDLEHARTVAPDRARGGGKPTKARSNKRKHNAAGPFVVFALSCHRPHSQVFSALPPRRTLSLLFSSFLLFPFFFPCPRRPLF